MKIIVQVESELEELIPGFISNRHKDISKMDEYLDKEDYESIKLIGHTMKGNGAGYGFDELSEFGKRIELAAEECRSEDVKRLIKELVDYLNQVSIEYV
jgi:HPt (histidine-containing phosphotransfer) domain-containing protein